MRKRMALILILFTLTSMFMLKFDQSMVHITAEEDDGIIEWQNYHGKKWIG